ncbi:hypothetical protein NM688_g1006 [Phlebia brevispora]|uniref:Uncharacterized protein n=1 Tax=Phlebia brevispora TaxID=194682 RepID=A0ACC1TCI1_9APHY|nr:hypothetical protein NM688_g1006 [Phlebia brevispora]
MALCMNSVRWQSYLDIHARSGLDAATLQQCTELRAISVFVALLMQCPCLVDRVCHCVTSAADAPEGQQIAVLAQKMDCIPAPNEADRVALDACTDQLCNILAAALDESIDDSFGSDSEGTKRAREVEGGRLPCLADALEYITDNADVNAAVRACVHELQESGAAEREEKSREMDFVDMPALIS